MLKDFREKVNLKLYSSKNTVLSFFRVAHVIVALSMIGVLVYYYGFPQTEDSRDSLLRIIEYSFLFYILRFFVKFVYDFNPVDFFKRNWFETIVIFLLLAEGISYNLFDTLLLSDFFVWLGFKGFADISNILIQLFFIIYIITETVKKRDFGQWMKIHPGLLFTISILTIICVGTGLLMLPEMTQSDGGISFTDALFLSTSSTSVTGLTTVDITQVLTYKGQLVILILIQIGGLNTIAFGALYLLIAKFGIGLKQHDIIEDFVNRDSLLDTESMFFRIVKWALIIELVGILCIFFLLEPEGIFANPADRLFQAVFHSVSAFNNAGLTIIPGGLMNDMLAQNYLLHTVILVLFFLGGFGMIYLFDLFQIKNLRERMKYPWKSIQFGTKISLYFTLGLLFSGAIVFFIFEQHNTLTGQSSFGKFVTSLFESMTTRNAGFNTVDTGSLALPVLMFFLFLMFVGAGSGSSGGGIRVSTFAVMVSSVISTIRGKSHVELFKRTLSNDLVLKAYSIFVFFVVLNLVGIFILVITEHTMIENGTFTLTDIIFEHVSAASTVGLSTGITEELSAGGKYVLIVAMFVGRVGTLTLAYLFGKQVLSRNYKYPSGHTMIG
ncbi:MAG: potassium transporter TrkG [Brumimicrobium sp.]|nr:potassium transporter TrkG [Brumimicrobium sp.]